MGEEFKQAPTTALGEVQCPNCKERIIVGIGIQPPEILYGLKEGDLEARKQAFLDDVEKSTMSEQQKGNIKAIYGGDTVVDPVTLQLMHEEVKKHYTGVKLG